MIITEIVAIFKTLYIVGNYISKSLQFLPVFGHVLSKVFYLYHQNKDGRERKKTYSPPLSQDVHMNQLKGTMNNVYSPGMVNI